MPLTEVTNTPLPRLPARASDSHKGDYGRALLIGGSRGMTGAMGLAGMATLRSGAGLVTLAVPHTVQDTVASFEPSYMTHGLDDENGHLAARAADELLDLTASATAVALGPGLGRSAALTEIVARLYIQIARPLVVDADGLFALAERPALLAQLAGPRILTPHPGEFARLTGQPYDPSQRVAAAARLAGETASASGKHPIIVVLKGHHTVVTDGHRYSTNQTGNPGMATGGSGDVLTGIITALVCQGLTPYDAARLGVHIHGKAGDLAATDFGEVSLIASDLIDYLPAAFQSLA